MCGFYSRDEIGRDAYKEYFSVEHVEKTLTAPRFNIRPKSPNVVITKNSPNKAEEMLWWFHPGWPGFPESRGVVNVRIESIKEDKPYFKKAFHHQRCLIPATSWVEWKSISNIKIPHVFKIKSRKIFAFAGLWNEYTNELGKQVKGYAIITTSANSLAATIHDRQPVVLREEDHAAWLDPEETDVVTLLKCLKSYPSNDMEIYPVGRDLSENSRDILKPLTSEELQAELKKKPKRTKVLRLHLPAGQSKLVD